MGTENGDKLGGEIGRCGGIGEQCEKPLESTERARALFDHIWSRCHSTLRWRIPSLLQDKKIARKPTLNLLSLHCGNFCAYAYTISNSLGWHCFAPAFSTGKVTCIATKYEDGDVCYPRGGPGPATNVDVFFFDSAGVLLNSAHFVRLTQLGCWALWNGIRRVTCTIWNSNHFAGRKWVVSAER
jgi:hypothetical protein